VRLDRVDIRLPGGLECPLPRMVLVEQRPTAERIENITAAVRREMRRFASPSLRGARIAVTAGSRGVASIREITAAAIAELRDWGAEPFIVPAMGSHGGATAEGQAAVLAEYGITEATMDAPVRASMETVVAARLSDGTPLYLDRIASQADGIVVCGRVKPHTDFRGDYESGLYKMLAVGLGKHDGATTLHRHGFGEFPRLVPEAGRALLKAVPVLMGLAVVENGYHQVMAIEAVAPGDWDEREKALLVLARRAMPRLRMRAVDVLIVDELGKDVSGAGMDPNVTGRGTAVFHRRPADDLPAIQRLFVRSLSRDTDGNACGIGVADVTTLRCADQIDFGKTYINTITSIELGGAKLPLVCNNDREALVIALRTCKGVEPAKARVVWIKNTNELGRIRVSEAILRDLDGCADVRVLGPSELLTFNADGILV